MLNLNSSEVLKCQLYRLHCHLILFCIKTRDLPYERIGVDNTPGFKRVVLFVQQRYQHPPGLELIRFNGPLEPPDQCRAFQDSPFQDQVFEGDSLGKAVDKTVLTPLRSEEHTSELQSRGHLVCRLLLEKKK